MHNMTNVAQELRLTDLNFIASDNWYDAISGMRLDDQSVSLELSPYQSLWITNK